MLGAAIVVAIAVRVRDDLQARLHVEQLVPGRGAMRVGMQAGPCPRSSPLGRGDCGCCEAQGGISAG